MIDHVSRVLLLNPLPEVDLQLYGFYLEKKQYDVITPPFDLHADDELH